MSRGDPQNTGRVDLTLKRKLGELKAWRFRGGSHVWGYKPGMSVWSSAAVALIKGRATVFVGSYDHNLYALDAISGKRRFRFTSGGGVYSAPAVWRGEGQPLVFFTSADRSIYALDADLGRRVWIHSVKTWRPTIGGARLSSPAIGRAGKEAAVFFAHWVWDKSLSSHLQAGGVTALAAKTGKKLWTTALGDNQLSSPVVVELADKKSRIFIASENGNLYALAADTGQVLWSAAQRNVIKASPAVYLDGKKARVIIGSKHGLLRCLDAESGDEIWQFKTGHWIDGSAVVGAVGGRTLVFVGSYDTSFYAIGADDGKKLWRHHTAGGIFSSAALLVDKDKNRADIFFASWDHHLYNLAAEDGTLRFSAYTGRPLWDSITLGDSIWSSPTIAVINGQPMIYFGSYSGPFYATPLKEAAKKALARPGSNINFWLTLPLVLIGVTLILIVLSRRQRRLEASRQKGASPR